ncbi:MAG: FG-GAP-like repeat-containing protein [candidate division WOR-3 bacterium]
MKSLIYLLAISFLFADHPVFRKERYEKILKEKPDNPEVLRQLGMTYFKLRDFDKAEEYLKKSLSLSPTFETKVWYYKAKAKLAEGKEREVKRLKEEIKNLIKEKSEENLTIAYEVFSIIDTNQAKILSEEIVKKFPESKTGYLILVHNLFYDSLYPIWNNDTLKIQYLNRFLERYPKTEWRFTAYQYLLTSLFYLKDYPSLITNMERMLKEDSLNPLAYNFAANLLLRAETLTMRAKEYARKARELAPGFKKFPNLPEEQWQLQKPRLLPDANFNYARAYFRLGDLDSAEIYATKAIEGSNFDLDNDATSSPYYYLLGQIKEKKGDLGEAIKNYCQSLIEGDVNNFWSKKSDSALKRIFKDTTEILPTARKIFRYRGPTFLDITEQVGLKERRETRVAFGDYDNDGYEDLLLNGCKLFKNIKGKEFQEVSAGAGLGNFSSGGGLFADFDNDGFLDIIACGGGEKGDRIFKNNGDGTFTEMTEIANVSDSYPTEGLGVGDYNNDGFLDIYFANYEDWATHKYFPDFLYRNNGNFQFTNVTESAGIIPPFKEDRAGRGVNWCDYNEDGLIDIYVSNYRLQENFLWHNLGDGKFINLAPKLGIAGDETLDYYGHTIGSEWTDYDNDGDFDLITCNLAHPRYIEFSNRTRLYQNQGAPDYQFIDKRKEAGIKYEETHSEPCFGDLDNDGDLDLYLTSVYENRRSFLYENDGKGKFFDITYLSGTRVFNGWGAAFCDFDNDGDLDLIVGSGSGLKFFANQTKNKGNYLKIKLVGQKSNRDCIGAKITAYYQDKIMARQVEGGKGTTNQNSLIIHFGFGKYKGPVKLEIKFPSGKRKVLENIKLNQLLVVSEES